VGISPSSVGRIWAEAGLKPHLTRGFKVSNDPMFEEKVTDIVGLYLDPPERAVVLCVDEKSQIQALDRTQPGLPLKKGRAQTMTHDYKRHGTTTLFAALDVKSGMVIGECLPRHPLPGSGLPANHERGAREFLRFLRRIDRAVLKPRDVHLVLDNYATHKTTSFQGADYGVTLGRLADRRQPRQRVQKPKKQAGADQPDTGRTCQQPV
jgi:hypothetical protein